MFLETHSVDMDVNTTTRLVNALNGGTANNSILEEFILDFFNDGSVVSDESDEDSDGDDTEFDPIQNSYSSDNEDETGGTAAPGGVQLSIAPLLPEQLAGLNDVVVECDRPAEMDKIRSFDCKCNERRKENSGHKPVSCSQKLDADMIYQNRIEIQALTKDERDMFMLGVIKTCMNDSEMTQSSKQVNKKRKIIRSTYMINTVVVCRATFCFVHG